jgi:serine/threonine protein phosphatase PrpC
MYTPMIDEIAQLTVQHRLSQANRRHARRRATMTHRRWRRLVNTTTT